jgi:O-antigen/teichoic acid export membrane protein
VNKSLARWTARLGDERVLFVVVGVGVNLLLLVRSLVAMKVLDHSALGSLALLQSLMLFVGTLHFGVLNGGYRLLCGAGGREPDAVNDLVHSFLVLVGAAALAIAAMLAAATDSPLAAAMLLLGSGAGVLTLLRNWLANQMTARVMLARLNQANLVSGLASVLVLVAVPWAPMASCVTSILVQPLVFLLLAWGRDPSLRPGAFRLSRPLMRQVVASGFIVFLTGALLQLNAQAERWYVAGALGVEALGHLYLAILFVTLFQLVPNTLDGLMLPRLVNAHEAGDTRRLRHELRIFLSLLLGYSLLALALLALLAEPLLSALLPKHVPDLRYVWIVVPGLVLLTLAGPLAIAFNVLVRYRTFLVAYGLTSLATLGAFALAWFASAPLDLDRVSAVRSAGYGAMAAVIAWGWWWISAEHGAFRFRPWPLPVREAA